MPAITASTDQTRETIARAVPQNFTYIYLTSVEHSGSTLISCIYDAHPQVTSVGEFAVDHGARLKCPCGTTVCECPFWNAWSEQARLAGYEFPIGNLGINLMPGAHDGFLKKLYLHQLSSRRLTSLKDMALSSSNVKKSAEQAIETSIALAKVACRMQGTNVFVDTSKNPLQIRHLARRTDINFKMIGLIRDGRAVMKSVIEKENYTTEQAIGAWKWGIKHMHRAMQYVSPENRLLLKLEDLCHSPEPALHELFDFAGVDPDAELDFSPASRHLTGNRMRLQFDGEIRPHDDSWKDRLSREQIDKFERSAGHWNRRLGYAKNA